MNTVTDTLRITVGGYQPPESVLNRAVGVFSDSLAESLGATTNFGAEVVLQGNMPQSHGIKAADLLTLVESGELTMCYFSASYLEARVPELAVFDLPFVLDDREKAYALFDGAVGKLIKDRFRALTGFELLGFWDYGFRNFTSGVRPIRTPADCAGLTARAMDSDIHKEMFRLLGTEAAHVDVRDLPGAVADGKIELQENALTNFYRFGMHKHHHYVTLTRHLFGLSLFLCHRATFESWPEEVRQAVVRATDDATRAQRGFAATEDDEMVEALRAANNELVFLSDAERNGFIDAMAPIVAQQRAKLGDDLVNQVVDHVVG